MLFSFMNDKIMTIMRIEMLDRYNLTAPLSKKINNNKQITIKFKKMIACFCQDRITWHIIFKLYL